MKDLLYLVIFITIFFLVLYGGRRCWKSWKRSLKEKRAFSEALLIRCRNTSKVSAVPERVKTMLDQPYVYLAKGKQSYVFVSINGEYVLKFLKKRKLSMLDLLVGMRNNLLSRYLRKKNLNKEKKRINRFKLSQTLAHADLKKETGVEYIHMHRCGINEKVLLLDPRGEVLQVDIDELQFIIQHTIAPLKETFVRLMHANQIEEAKLRVHAIFDLLENCCKKNIWDRDTGLIQNGNIGFLESKAVYIDTGKLAPFKKGNNYITYDLKRLNPLGKWFSAYYPELAGVFEQRYNEMKSSEL